MNTILHPWIQKGYQTFAYNGVESLKVERLSKQVGKNKSSFYHHFADLEIFISKLLEYHLLQAQILAEKEAACRSLEELIEIIIEHKIDLLFNRQLRIHRENTEFEACFCKTNQITLPAFLKIWSEILDLKDNSYLSELMLKLSLENFYLQITDETLNAIWLNNYFTDLKKLVKEFKRTSKIPLQLNGNV